MEEDVLRGDGGVRFWDLKSTAEDSTHGIYMSNCSSASLSSSGLSLSLSVQVFCTIAAPDFGVASAFCQRRTSVKSEPAGIPFRVTMESNWIWE